MAAWNREIENRLLRRWKKNFSDTAFQPAKCLLLLIAAGPLLGCTAIASSADRGYTGTQSCRECHEKFHQLWSPSIHGLAMQAYTDAFASDKLTAGLGDVIIGQYRYTANVARSKGFVSETGPDGRKRYKIAHALGGKNVYYFLTPMDRGRLQTLPVAYDVREKKWFDMAKTGVRHFPGLEADEPILWTDRPYTFNTACYGCHVSRLDTNYDLESERPRSGRKLHAYELAVKPLREIRSTQLLALTHIQWEVPPKRRSQSGLHALPPETGGKRRRAHPTQGRWPGEQMHRLPHAPDRICQNASERPFHASAHSVGHNPFPVPQCVQWLS